MNWDDGTHLYHHGIKGQKWGVRRFQNKDGSLTPAGEKRYDDNGPAKTPSKPSQETKKSIGGTKVFSKKGVEVALESEPTPLLAKMVSKVSKKAKDNIERSDYVQVKVKGESVGELQLYRESKKSINIVWVSIDSEHEGNGYGGAVMQAVKDYAKKSGMEQLTLEVPGSSPNARHIYEKLGFKATKQISENDAWGGLTAMVLDLKNEDK